MHCNVTAYNSVEKVKAIGHLERERERQVPDNIKVDPIEIVVDFTDVC